MTFKGLASVGPPFFCAFESFLRSRFLFKPLTKNHLLLPIFLFGQIRLKCNPLMKAAIAFSPTFGQQSKVGLFCLHPLLPVTAISNVFREQVKRWITTYYRQGA